jgi:hypothetical protein
MNKEVRAMGARGQFVVDHERVVHETIDGETILVQLETGNYYSLRGTGVEIWSLLESGHSTEEITDQLKLRYEAESELLEGATQSLAAELVDEQLLEPFIPVNGDVAPRYPVTLAEPEPRFSRPQLEKFTDMQGFLLLDPIDDTDSSGWPHRKPNESA